MRGVRGGVSLSTHFMTFLTGGRRIKSMSAAGPLGLDKDHSLFYPRMITIVGLILGHVSISGRDWILRIFPRKLIYIAIWVCKFVFAFPSHYPDCYHHKLKPCRPLWGSMQVLSPSLPPLTNNHPSSLFF